MSDTNLTRIPDPNPLYKFDGADVWKFRGD